MSLTSAKPLSNKLYWEAMKIINGEVYYEPEVGAEYIAYFHVIEINGGKEITMYFKKCTNESPIILFIKRYGITKKIIHCLANIKPSSEGRVFKSITKEQFDYIYSLVSKEMFKEKLL